MKNLLYKEFKLSLTVQSIMLVIMSAFICIPNWPTLVAFFYPLGGLISILPISIANRDSLFSSILPIKKSDVVKGKILLFTALELISIAISIPFGLLKVFVVNPSLVSSSEANISDLGFNFALYGFVLLVYSIFNLIYIPWYYKDNGKHILATLVSLFVPLILLGLIMTFFMINQKVSLFINDFSNPLGVVTQLLILLIGIGAFIGFGALGVKIGGKNFSKVDL